MREAPSVALIRGLLNCGASVSAYDPIAIETASSILPKEVSYAADETELLKDADCAILVTEWPQFKNLDWSKLAPLMKQKIIIDGRNVYDIKKMEEYGFEYYCIGRNKRP